MKLLALALGLLLEHLATQILHLREIRWFDAYFDFGLAQIAKANALLGLPLLLVVLAVPTLPVGLISLGLQGPKILWDLAYLSFAVLVVFLCLGPRDLGSEVEEYCVAMDNGDSETARRVLLEMSEAEHPRSSEIDIVEDAVFVQANNRIFGVLFWFMLLGPVGAWFFRISDLLRRRAVFESIRDYEANEQALSMIEAIFGILKWAPARLAMLGYMLSGSFDGGWNAWRAYQGGAGIAIDRRNDDLAAIVGKAAMTGIRDEPPNSSAAAQNSMKLVTRTVFIWVIFIGLFTIFGWSL
jgi:AmpE protein